MKFHCESCNCSYQESELQSVPGVSSAKLCPTCQKPCFLEGEGSTIKKSSTSGGDAIKWVVMMIVVIGGMVLFFKGSGGDSTG